MKRRRFALKCASCLFAGIFSTSMSASALGRELVVFAAASLKNALDENVAHFKARTGLNPVISYGGSSALAKQIANGAPAAVFISADLDWMNYLEERQLIDPASRRNLLGNRLVLVAPRDRPVLLSIEPNFPIAQALGSGRLAIGNPAYVPAGKYAKSALEALGVWNSVSERIAASENVRAALALVARGEAPLGIVYQTDAGAEKNVKVVGVFPEDTHTPIVYPVALTRAAQGPLPARFVSYLTSPDARAIFERHGFVVVH